MDTLATISAPGNYSETQAAYPGGHQAARSHTGAPSPTVRGTSPRGGLPPSEGALFDQGAPSSRDGAPLHLILKNKFRRASNDAGKRSGSPSLYPVKKLSFNKWKGAVHRELVLIALASPPKARKKIVRRATAFSMCGNYVAAERCSDCNAPSPLSGRLTFKSPVSERPHPCNSGICPVCNRVRSAKRSTKLLAALNSLPQYKSYTYKALTLTVRYDSSNEDHLSIEGIRARVLLLKEAIRETWNFIMGPKGSRGWCTSNIEIAGNGFVHAHLLAYCPIIPKEVLENRLRETIASRLSGSFVGFSHIKRIEAEPSSYDFHKAVLEVCKYNAKGPSPLSECFYDRSTMRFVMNPVLAARFEVATTDGRFSRIQLSQIYGDLRGHMSNDDAVTADDETSAEAPSAPQPCPCCGSHKRKDVLEWAVSFVEACHANGYGALQGSRWKAPEPPGSG